ncbi:MAG: hypothetical protein RDV48_14720 [Candidatus Eremiobacteraeota bacterium]|nr:hypothetical protein [Candidatus Eremiobacteraeota bacterium]
MKKTSLFLAGLAACLLLLSPAAALARYDQSLVPERTLRLVPFEALSAYARLYMPAAWKPCDGGETSWTFQEDARQGRGPVTVRLSAAQSFRTFDDFLLSLLAYDEKARVTGPIGFPDKFEDHRERYFVHFIRDTAMCSAIYGSACDMRGGRKVSFELVFPTDDFDFYDALSYTILSRVSPAGGEGPAELVSFRRWVKVASCRAIDVPPEKNSPEEAVSAYYGHLITNRWEKARQYLDPDVDRWSFCEVPQYKERIWWTVAWYKLLYLSVYSDDEVECAVMKGVHQYGDEGDGVDYLTVKRIKGKWYIATFP